MKKNWLEDVKTNNIIQLISVSIVIVQVLGGGIFVLNNPNERAFPITFIILNATIVIVLLITLHKIRKMSKVIEILKILSKIQKNSLERGTLRFTNVFDIIHNSPEQNMPHNSAVKILTHSLSTFDTSKNALDMISTNITNNAKYEYFLPNNDMIKSQIKKMINQIKDSIMERIRDSSRCDDYLNNVRFFLFDEKKICAFYNFVIIDRADSVHNDRYAWYITEDESQYKDGEIQNDRKAISSKLKSIEDKEALDKAFVYIRDISAQFNPLAY